ncbi:hypothetical protein GW755_02280 [bacterium]|nr:hypothetical protein [bacterium]
MFFGITKTVPASEGDGALNQLYNGTIKTFEFHMAGTPSKLKVGDYVYTIFKDKLRGRLKIVKLILGSKNPDSGSLRTLIIVGCPGELIKNTVTKKGHRGTRYYDGVDWN